MKFSVLMSVYKNDNADYLQQALMSIYDEQTRKPDEIVVVFDGPLTEELYVVLENFKKGKEEIVVYLPQDTNKGLGQALKIGSEQCKGDYIFRMDSDDISHPCRFEKQIAYIQAHPETDVLGTDISEFYSNPDESDMRVRVCPPEHKEIVEMAKRRSPMNHVTALIKREALVRSGGYETLLLLEDYLLWLKMIISGCVFANINESLVYVRIGNGFHSKRGSPVRVVGWTQLQKIMIKNKMITKTEALMNLICIRVFIYCPSWVKKLLYDKILRK